jgi:hypothetical protein
MHLLGAAECVVTACVFVVSIYYIYLIIYRRSESRRRRLAATGSSLFLINANEVSFEIIFYVCFKSFSYLSYDAVSFR